jgi:hypothetical protein
MKQLAAVAVMAAAMLMMTATLFAAEQATPKSEPIYGYRMMSDQERNEYRERMRTARSGQERQAIRDEHRKLMEARAKERGVTLPGPRGPRAGGPGPRGGGPGAAMGPGAGMGPGGGMGPGKGPGYGPGPRADCPAGQDCPGPGAGKGPRQQ